MAEQETRPPDEAPAGDEERHEDDAKNGGGGAGGTVAQELKEAVREAALEVLGPAARQATSSAAKYAVSKGPELVTKNVMPAVLKAGGASGLAQQAMSKGGEALSGSGGLTGVFGKLWSKLGRGGKGGGGAATGWGKGRRMPVQQVAYVSVPIRHAYDGWTEYKQWPRYMHRANQSDAQIDEKEARVKVTEKMWGFKRPFTAEIVEQRPDEHIRWNATEGVKHTGVINFHELGPRLTLIEVNVDHSPSGPLEKIARGARFDKRAVRADFHRFQGWIEMKTVEELEELEGWRGTIEGGQVVKSHEETLEEEQREEDGGQPEPEGEYDEEPEDAYDEEAEDEYDEEPEAEFDEEPEAEFDEEPEGEYDEEPEAEYDEEPDADEYDEEPEGEYDEEPEDTYDEEPEAEAESAAPKPRQPRRRTRQRGQPDGRSRQTGRARTGVRRGEE
jgi:uncharacterized membrane protein